MKSLSNFISNRFSKLKEYVPGEQPRDFNYIKLNTNESPYPPAPQVIEALNKVEIENLRLYSDPECKALREELAAYYNISAKNIMIGNGSDDILMFIFMAYCDKLTGVSYPDISYGFYPVYADLFEIEKNEIPLKEDFSIDKDDYLNVGTTVVIANPNAPTGTCLSVNDIEKIVISNPNNVVAIDEAYIDFGGESCIPLTKEYDNLLVIQTYSKSRSLAGARLGYVIGNESLIADLNKLRYSTNPYNINRLTQLAGIAALKNREYYDNNNETIIQNRDYTSAKLKESGFLTTDSKANFIFATHPMLDGKTVYEGLKERGILVRHFNKPRISEHVRISVGTRAQMDALIDSLKEMLAYEKI